MLSETEQCPCRVPGNRGELKKWLGNFPGLMRPVRQTAPKQTETQVSSLTTGKGIVMMSRGIFNQQETYTVTGKEKRKSEKGEENKTNSHQALC